MPELMRVDVPDSGRLADAVQRMAKVVRIHRRAHGRCEDKILVFPSMAWTPVRTGTKLLAGLLCAPGSKQLDEYGRHWKGTTTAPRLRWSEAQVGGSA